MTARVTPFAITWGCIVMLVFLGGLWIGHYVALSDCQTARDEVNERALLLEVMAR